jgi:hypothetical protein
VIALVAALLVVGVPEGAHPAPAAAEASLRARLDAGLSARLAGAPRATWASALLLGARYAPSPLGEGAEPDTDPRFRLDRFDCTTLVETALALGASRSVDEARERMDAIRYSGEPSFAARRHYVEAQWLPALVAAGWLRDATAEVGGEGTVEIEIRHRRADWEAAARAGRLVPGLDPGELPDGVSRLRVVPLARVAGEAPRIPEGAVVLVAREPRPGRPYAVVHMGMVVSGPGGARQVRHASADAGRVVDEPLERFVARYARQRRWPVAGLAFLETRNPTAR